MDAARMLLEAGAICNEHTFDGDRCHYAALTLRIRRLLKQYEMRPPPLAPLPRAFKEALEASQAVAAALAEGDSGSSRASSSWGSSSERTLGPGSSTSTSANSSASSAASDSWGASGVHPALEPDVIFVLVADPRRPRIAAHRAILASRSRYFRAAFTGKWKHKREIFLTDARLTVAALQALISFFYCDRFDIDVDDLPALERVCRSARCTPGLIQGVEREIFHLDHAQLKTPAYSMSQLGKARPRRIQPGTEPEDEESDVGPTAAVAVPRRCILQAASLGEADRLPAAMQQLLQWCRLNSGQPRSEDQQRDEGGQGRAAKGKQSLNDGHQPERGLEDCDDLADMCLVVQGRHFRCHRMVLASRSDYFKALFTHSLPATCASQDSASASAGSCAASSGSSAATSSSSSNTNSSSSSGATSSSGSAGTGFRTGRTPDTGSSAVPCSCQEPSAAAGRVRSRCRCCRDSERGQALIHMELQDVDARSLEVMLEYMYTDRVTYIKPSEASGVFDSASRFLLFSLKRAAADALLPHLEDSASFSELCDWLLLADFYGVWKIREHCLNIMAANFDEFAALRRFRQMLRHLPPPSGEDSLRTTAPQVPGTEVGLPAPLPPSAAEAVGGQGEGHNVLDDLREKWLELEGAELEARDESAAEFDARLMGLAKWAEEEAEELGDGDGDSESGCENGEEADELGDGDGDSGP